MTGTPVTPAVLSEWVTDVVDRTLELIADLDEDQLIGPLLPTVNPLLWEIAHLAWFQEKFVLRQACGRDPILPYGDALYDSGAVPHDTRWRLVLPSLAETKNYMRTVAGLVADELNRPGVTDVVRHFTQYAVHHYDMHTEALTYTRQNLGYRPPVLTGLSGTWPDGGDEHGPVSGDVTVIEGEFLLGAAMSDPFAFDHEKWAHRAVVAPFSIARAATTQAEFAAFVEAGGYKDARLWSDAGAWLATTARHECLRLIRLRGRELATDESSLFDAPTDDPVDARLITRERDRALQRALRTVGERCQSLLRMLAAPDPPSYEEIGAALGMPIGAIGPTRARCLEKLRRSPDLVGLGPA